jgi:hypothetical protein
MINPNTRVRIRVRANPRDLNPGRDGSYTFLPSYHIQDLKGGRYVI